MTQREAEWYLLHTRSRHEQKVAKFLELRHFTAYVPLKRTWSRRRDRKQVIEAPALPGYLFVRCQLCSENRSELKRAPGVVELVERDGRPLSIPEGQIHAIRIALAHSFNPEWHPYLACGERVRVNRGRMAGIEGMLVRVDAGQHRLVIGVEAVNRALSIAIDPDLVEPIDSPLWSP